MYCVGRCWYQFGFIACLLSGFQSEVDERELQTVVSTRKLMFHGLFFCEKLEKGYLVIIYFINSVIYFINNVIIYFLIFFPVKIPERVNFWLCVAFWKTINVYV